MKEEEFEGKLGEGVKLTDLVTKPQPICDQCGAKATVLILEDSDEGLLSVAVTRCNEHLVEGAYDIDLYGDDSLTDDLTDWLFHTEGKGGTKAFETLMDWLRTPSGKSIIVEAAMAEKKAKGA